MIIPPVFANVRAFHTWPYFYDFDEIFFLRFCRDFYPPGVSAHTPRARARARAARSARDARALAIERADIDERARAC